MGEMVNIVSRWRLEGKWRFRLASVPARTLQDHGYMLCIICSLGIEFVLRIVLRVDEGDYGVASVNECPEVRMM